MKHLTKSVLTFSSLVLILTFCKGPQTASNQTSISTPPTNSNQNLMTTIDVPCAEFSSDDEYFRETQSFKSPNMAMAKRSAIRQAGSLLSQDLEAFISQVADDWSKQIDKDTDSEYSGRSEDMIRTVVDELKLSGFRTLCEKIQQNTQSGEYTVFVTREIAKDALLKKVDDKISDDEVLRIDYDYEKFKNQFNEEMERRREDKN